ncbi:MAG: carbon-nitrogen hydrolase family protein [Armatimonadota bacterium]
MASPLTVADHRVVTLSTLCFLDRDDCRSREYALKMLTEACERADNDLVVAPYMPFLSIREGAAAEDLAPFAALARRHKTYIALAVSESAGGKTYATSVLLDRRGRIPFKWRKTHALADDDIALGDALEVFRTDFGVIGATIGTDFYFPEVYETLRMKGAEILIWHHFPERLRDHSGWEPLLTARAFDSHAHFVTAMYADPRTYITNRYEMGMQGAAFGRSMILNRVGVPIADTGYEDGVATATVDLDKRKADPSEPYVENENCFFVNCLGDRAALKPVAQPWKPPRLPRYRKRIARVAVAYMWPRNMWRGERAPTRMLELIDEAAQARPDIVLLSEMSAPLDDEEVRKAYEAVGQRARKMNAYIAIGGIQDETGTSVAHVWDREGNVVYQQPIYWTKGFPEIEVFDTDFGRVGTHTCGDLYTPMFDRVLALKGAELILDPSQMWGPSGRINETLLRARALDNAVWLACAHWNTSDPGLRSVIIDPYGQVMASSKFQQEGVIWVDVDFDARRVYYGGRKPSQPKRGEVGIPSYFSEDIPEQKPGWRQMVFSRRRPDLYGIIPTVNEVIMKYRPPQ